MKDVRQTMTIDKSASEVFDFTINPTNTPRWVAAVVKEKTNESPTKLGTIYRNQGADGSWAEFEITAFEEGSMFELTKKDDDHHVRYTFKPQGDNHCELEYSVWADGGNVSERFAEAKIQAILQKLKAV